MVQGEMNEGFDGWLPPWATGMTNGELCTGAQLCTRDGRRMGNAVILCSEERASSKESLYFVVTDVGSLIRMNRYELAEAFFDPVWVMDPDRHPGVIQYRKRLAESDGPEAVQRGLKHTPGPWFPKREGWSAIYVEARIGGGMLQEVAVCGPTEAGKDQQEANALLISAAPEMLQSLLVLLSLHDARVDTADAWNTSMEEARAAIAKATGE